MKAFLMFPDRDFDPTQRLVVVTEPSYRRRDKKPFDPWETLPWNARDLAQDLELQTLFEGMADEDPFLLEVARTAILSATDQNADIILYRQEILRDCLASPQVIRRIYQLTIDVVEAAHQKGGWLAGNYPSGKLSRSIGVLQIFVDALRQLRSIAETEAGNFASAGFSQLLLMLRTELNDAYFAEIEAHLKRLRFRNGVLLSVRLGQGNKGRDYVLRSPLRDEQGWLSRLLAPHPEAYTLTVAPRDEAGARALSEIRDRGLSLVADATSRSTDHIQSFFIMLRTELAFYVACLNLHDRLVEIDEPTCMPMPTPPDQPSFACGGLYDVALALSLGQQVVGNDIDAKASNLIVVTGANRGGKSTFLRSFGQAQLMMQAGMFAPANSLRMSLVRGAFTHFKREEDDSMQSGKLDEELARMSEIVDHLSPDALVLFNESFASTNEREGSEIARQITTALEARHVRIVHVTHLYTFSHGLHEAPENRFFLRAERAGQGGPSYRLVVGAPRATSFGTDLYQKIFEPAATD